MSRPEEVRPAESDSRGNGVLSDLRILSEVAWRFSPRKVALQAVLLLLAGVVGGVSLLLLIPIVNSVAQSATTTALPIPGLDGVNLSAVPLPALLVAFVALVAISSFITWWSSVNATALQQTIVDDLRQDAFDAILGAHWEFALQKRRSDIIELVTTGASRSGLAFYFLLRLLVGMVLFIATAVVALVVAPAVASLSILGVLVLGAVQGSAVRASHRLGGQFGQRNRRLQAVMTDSMASLRLVRAHSAGAVWAQRLGEAFSDTRATQIAQTRRTSTITAFSSVGLAFAASVLVYIATLMDTPPTAIVIILLLVARLARQMQSMTSTAVTLANALPAVRDLTELTASARAAAEVTVTQSTSTTRRELSRTANRPLVQLQDVTYTYPLSTNGVHDISLEVPRGQVTAITGHSGSGKSTTADIILGLLTPQSGAVIIDGQPLRPEDLAWWRAHIAYVPQETVLIPGSLRENLLWSSDASSDDVCWHALDRAAATFAHNLPDGLDTVLGDHGVRLSGGERQRVAIARALVREPTLLIMDESTSSLDEVTESRVLELLRTLTPSVTVLVIAHRRSTIDLADQVIRFDNGRILS